MQRLITLSLLAVTSITSLLPTKTSQASVNRQEPNYRTDYIKAEPIFETKTNFGTKTVTTTEETAFETEIIKDENMEYGKEIVEQEGKKGKKITTFQLTFWNGQEKERKLIKTEIKKPQKKIIRKGTKVAWKLLPTREHGRIKYWAKLENVWATSYDGNCPGCRGLTYSGTEVKKGVCAVDPEIIPLGTNMYIPGYGLCRAEDIGGAIKGKDIDLGFENVEYGFWSAKYTDVYLLTQAENDN